MIYNSSLRACLFVHKQTWKKFLFNIPTSLAICAYRKDYGVREERWHGKRKTDKHLHSRWGFCVPGESALKMDSLRELWNGADWDWQAFCFRNRVSRHRDHLQTMQFELQGLVYGNVSDIGPLQKCGGFRRITSPARLVNGAPTWKQLGSRRCTMYQFIIKVVSLTRKVPGSENNLWIRAFKTALGMYRIGMNTLSCGRSVLQFPQFMKHRSRESKNKKQKIKEGPRGSFRELVKAEMRCQRRERVLKRYHN